MPRKRNPNTGLQKRPSFQFYPGDIQKDPGYKRCTKAERGVFLDFLCLIHECPFPGAAFDNGTPYAPEEVAEAIGGDKQDNLHLLNGLITKGPIKVWSKVESKVGTGTGRPDLCPDFPDGVLYNRRMVKDTIKRIACSIAGIDGGGNPALKSTVTKQMTFIGHTKGQPKGGDIGRDKGREGSSSSSSDQEEREDPPSPPLGVVSVSKKFVPEYEWFTNEKVTEAWQGFLEMRREAKAAMKTPRAKLLSLGKLNRLGEGNPERIAAILDQSTMNCWKGLFPLGHEGGKSAMRMLPPDPEVEAARAIRKRNEEQYRPRNSDDTDYADSDAITAEAQRIIAELAD